MTDARKFLAIQAHAMLDGNSLVPFCPFCKLNYALMLAEKELGKKVFDGCFEPSYLGPRLRGVSIIVSPDEPELTASELEETQALYSVCKRYLAMEYEELEALAPDSKIKIPDLSGKAS